MASQTSLTGAAGEYYVLCELLRRNYIAALAPAGVPNAVIVVTNIEGSRQCSIQVKTRRGVGADGGWHMSIKHEKIRGERLFYCFVDFQSSDTVRPLVYVMPSAVVANAIAYSYKIWIDAPGKKGQRHNENKMRRLIPDFDKTHKITGSVYGAGWLDKYQDAWHLLKIDPIDPEQAIAEE